MAAAGSFAEGLHAVAVDAGKMVLDTLRAGIKRARPEFLDQAEEGPLGAETVTQVVTVSVRPPAKTGAQRQAKYQGKKTAVIDAMPALQAENTQLKEEKDKAEARAEASEVIVRSLGERLAKTEALLGKERAHTDSFLDKLGGTFFDPLDDGEVKDGRGDRARISGDVLDRPLTFEESIAEFKKTRSLITLSLGALSVDTEMAEEE